MMCNRFSRSAVQYVLNMSHTHTVTVLAVPWIVRHDHVHCRHLKLFKVFTLIYRLCRVGWGKRNQSATSTPILQSRSFTHRHSSESELHSSPFFRVGALLIAFLHRWSFNHHLSSKSELHSSLFFRVGASLIAILQSRSFNI